MARVNLSNHEKVLTAHRLAGPLVRKTSNQIVQAARRMAPNGDHTSGSGVRKPGLPLNQSLGVASTESTVNRIAERVGSRNNYAATAHQGSSPHVIRGHGKMLKFEWERGNINVTVRRNGRKRGRAGAAGNYFFFKMVHHPGNKRPVRYLTTPMHLYGRMNGFRTTSTPVSRSRLP